MIGKIPIKGIEKIINRASVSIQRELSRNEKPYNALRAQKRAEDNLRKKMTDMSRKRNSWKVKHSQPSLIDGKNHKEESMKNLDLETRLRNIEFQIEIILDTLKELQK
jgi:IS30 family transposase